MSVPPEQRFKRSRPCPVCGGGEDMPHRRGVRCAGYLTGDGRYAHCTREEHAGPLQPELGTTPTAYCHLLEGECRCGVSHGGFPREPARREIAAYDYPDELGTLLYQVVRFEPRGFAQRRPDGKGGWIWNLEGVRRVLYRLPELIAAVEAGERIFVGEGEKDVLALVEAGVVATCNSGGAGKWLPEHTETLAGASEVVIVAHRDKGGYAHAEQVRSSLAGKVGQVRVVEAAEGNDAHDHIEAGHGVDEFVPLEASEPSGNRRKPAAPSREFAHILDAVEAFDRRFIVCSEAQAALLALWPTHTHAIDAFHVTPYLHVTSAEEESGKTRVLEVQHLLVLNPELTPNISEAALFRVVDEAKGRMTLFFDEIDAVFNAHTQKTGSRTDMQALLNAGYRRGQKAIRMGGSHSTVPERFEVFCPKAFTGLGALPRTTASRCIRAELKRRLEGEPVEDFYPEEVAGKAEELRAELEAWADFEQETLRALRPPRVGGLRDRTNEVWRPLLAIATRAGSDWEARARDAAVALSTGGRVESSRGVLLLKDIHTIFEKQKREEIPTSELIVLLSQIEESPWAGQWVDHNGDPTKGAPRALSGLVGRYEISSKDVHVDDGVERKTLKGYHRDDFVDAWKRFPPTSPQSAPSAPSAPSGSHKQRDGADGADGADTFGKVKDGVAGVPDDDREALTPSTNGAEIEVSDAEVERLAEASRNVPKEQAVLPAPDDAASGSDEPPIERPLASGGRFPYRRPRWDEAIQDFVFEEPE